MRLASLVNQYVSEQAPWAAMEDDRERAGTDPLRRACAAIDNLKLLFTPFLPFTLADAARAARLRRRHRRPARVPRRSRRSDGPPHVVLTGDYATWVGALGAERRSPPGQALREPRAALSRSSIPSRSSRTSWRGCSAPPQCDRVTDTHAHLDALEEPGAAVARAREAGVTRIVTIGTGIDSCRAALELAAANDGVYAALGIDPHQAATDEADRVDELRELLGHEQGGRRRRDRARLSLRRRPPRRAARALRRRSSSWRDELAPAGRHPHRRSANADTEAILARARRARSSCTASPSPELLPAALERGWYVSFAGNVTYPKAAGAARRSGRASRRIGSSPRPTAPTSLRSRCAGARTSPRSSSHTLAALAEARGEDADELAAQIDANATAAFAPARERRRRRSGSASTSSPTRTSSASSAGSPSSTAQTSCSRSGPGSASSPATSPTRVGHRPRGRARPLARAAASPTSRREPNVELHWGDALALDLAALEPRADEARREPALQRRDADRRREPRPACRASSSGA